MQLITWLYANQKLSIATKDCRKRNCDWLTNIKDTNGRKELMGYKSQQNLSLTKILLNEIEIKHKYLT
jgi:hypothetical protein